MKNTVPVQLTIAFKFGDHAFEHVIAIKEVAQYHGYVFHKDDLTACSNYMLWSLTFDATEDAKLPESGCQVETRHKFEHDLREALRVALDIYEVHVFLEDFRTSDSRIP